MTANWRTAWIQVSGARHLISAWPSISTRPWNDAWLLTCAWFLIGACSLLAGHSVSAQVYRDPSAPVEGRVADLVPRMTTEEKFWQLFMLAGGLDGGLQRYRDGAFGFQVRGARDGPSTAARVDSVQRHFVEDTRLGIPIIAFEEALHGLVEDGATAFPQAIGLAATWDPALMHRVSGAIAEECRSAGIRQVLSPVVNLACDVRWGRVEETYGEDPYLASEMGVAFVSEFEQRGVITTPKHLIANVGDGGRDSYPVDVDERLLRELYLPPFAACILRGGSRSVMTSYNSLDGTPCSAGDWLNNKLIKSELGFRGFVISDAGAVGGANVLHFTARDYEEAAEHALKGGLDVVFQTSYDHYRLFIKPFQDGRIQAEVVDRAVARVLRAKFELGLFDRPYAGSAGSVGRWERGEHRAVALQAARESIVLLKNEKHTLPLSSGLFKIAVLGPDAAEARLGGYSGPGNDKVSILDEIKARVGASRVLYAEGCARTDPNFLTVGAEYLSCVQGDSTHRGLFGEYFDNVNLTGTPVFTRVDPELRFQWTLFSPDPSRLPYDFYSVRWTGVLRGPITGACRIGIDGNDGYRLYINGRMVIDNWRPVSRRTVLADYVFERDRQYDLKIECREPTGNAWFRLVWDVGMPGRSDVEMDRAVHLAEQGDAVVVVAGIEEGEFLDRASLGLPGRQEELISRVAATGKPMVVVLVGGSAITMARWLERVPAVLQVWYPGEAGGEAVAEVLFGDYNPAGRLPITFPVAEGQLPLVYNHKPTGRGDDYADLTGQPLFPFGYGLSYTEFEYGDLEFDRSRITAGDHAGVRCTVRNVGGTEGDEVVQMYIRDELASVARPVMELKGFTRIHLKPGETQTVRFAVAPQALTMLDRDLRPVVEPGDFRIMIGASSKDIRLRGILTVTE
jgi:beta-glucosidase